PFWLLEQLGPESEPCWFMSPSTTYVVPPDVVTPTFEAEARARFPQETVVNQGEARRIIRRRDAIGARARPPDAERPHTVAQLVGVVLLAHEDHAPPARHGAAKGNGRAFGPRCSCFGRRSMICSRGGAVAIAMGVRSKIEREDPPERRARPSPQ